MHFHDVFLLNQFQNCSWRFSEPVHAPCSPSYHTTEDFIPCACHSGTSCSKYSFSFLGTEDTQNYPITSKAKLHSGQISSPQHSFGETDSPVEGVRPCHSRNQGGDCTFSKGDGGAEGPDFQSLFPSWNSRGNEDAAN